jgi:hypothetical protein
MQVMEVDEPVEIPRNYTGIVEYPDGTRQWYLNGKLYRENGPAVERADGSKSWYLNGILHREDGPAIERADGGREWWRKGKQHREDGPAVEWASGRKAWFLNGECLFWWSPESQPFILLEEFFDEEGKEQVKVLTQAGIETWPNLPGLMELADNWEKK